MYCQAFCVNGYDLHAFGPAFELLIESLKEIQKQRTETRD